MNNQRPIAVTCISCRRRFTFILDAQRRREVPVLDEDGRPAGTSRILPRSFAVACPYCRVETVVSIF